MIKFSIIIPVYNVEKYMDKCLKSVLTQTYKNYEVIIINDGSPDNSQMVIDKYVKTDERFASFITENRGLSEARNYGLTKVTGDYILFLDGDDYFNKELLNELNNELKENPVDLIRFSCASVNEKGETIFEENNIEYRNEKTENVISELITRSFVETACLYCYKASFWKKFNFKYEKGKVHEDFGLTPLIIYYSKKMTSINYIGYYYLQRDNSITKTTNYEKIKKGVYDMYDQYIRLVEILSGKEDSIKKKVILTYIAECTIIKGRQLNKMDLPKYLKLLREDNTAKKIIPYNLKKILKRFIAMISLKNYIKIFGR